MVRDDTHKPIQAGCRSAIHRRKWRAHWSCASRSARSRKSTSVIKSSSEVEARGEAGDRADTCTGDPPDGSPEHPADESPGYCPEGFPDGFPDDFADDR